MEKYGDWTILGDSHRDGNSILYVFAECKCGNVRTVSYQNLKRGFSKRCNECRVKEKKIEVVPGKKYGSFKAIKYSHNDSKGTNFWEFKCDCGKTYIRCAYDITHGRTKQCQSCSSRKHGETDTKLYIIWRSMKSRCNNPKNISYKNYGGKGIKVCEDWNTYEQFRADMGLPPSDKHSLDRIDNSGNYCKENCKWATKKEQSNNRRSNTNYVNFHGKKITLGEFADIMKVDYKSLYYAYKKYGDDCIHKYKDV